MHHDAGDKVGPDRVDHAQVSIDRTDRAEHGPLSIASETVEDEMKNALSATTLRQIEAGEQEAPKAEPEHGRPRQRRVGSDRDKRKQADHREEKLGCRLECISRDSI